MEVLRIVGVVCGVILVCLAAEWLWNYVAERVADWKADRAAFGGDAEQIKQFRAANVQIAKRRAFSPPTRPAA